MKNLLKILFVAGFLTLHSLSANIVLNLTDTASEFITNTDSQAILLHYRTNLWQNSTLFLSTESLIPDQKIKMSLCNSLEPLECSNIPNPFESKMLTQPNFLFLIEIDPNSTYLIKSLLTEHGTNFIILPSATILKDATKKYSLALQYLSNSNKNFALLNMRINSFPQNDQYRVSLILEGSNEEVKNCVKDSFGFFQCIVERSKDYFVTFKNLGINSDFFIDYFLTAIPLLSSDSELSIRGISNTYSLIQVINNNDSPQAITTTINNLPLYLFGRVGLQENGLVIPSQLHQNISSDSGILIFQPFTSNFLSVISPYNFERTLTSKIITLTHVPLGREIVVNFDAINYPYSFYYTSINFVSHPLYLILKPMENSKNDAKLTWFVNRGSLKDSIAIPTDDANMFSSRETFSLLIEYPQAIYFTLKSSLPGNYSFYFVENKVSDVVTDNHSKPFPFYWIILGLIILELVIQGFLLLIFFLRDRIGRRTSTNNRVGQVQPEPSNGNSGPKSADEVKIEGLTELTLSQNQSKTISKEDILCIVCMDKKRNVIFAPCNHKISCINCSRKLYFETKKCPICRADIQKLTYEKTLIP